MVLTDVSPPTSKVVFTTTDGRTRSQMMRLDASVRELYQAAIKLFGIRYLPPKMHQRYLDTGDAPSLNEMEDVLKVQLFAGRKIENGEVTEQGQKINAQSLREESNVEGAETQVEYRSRIFHTRRW